MCQLSKKYILTCQFGNKIVTVVMHMGDINTRKKFDESHNNNDLILISGKK